MIGLPQPSLWERGRGCPGKACACRVQPRREALWDIGTHWSRACLGCTALPGGLYGGPDLIPGHPCGDSYSYINLVPEDLMTSSGLKW